MFWRPITRAEWAWVAGIALATIAWAIHRPWTLDPDHLGLTRPIRFPDDIIIVLLWLIYGFLRVAVRKRQSGVG